MRFKHIQEFEKFIINTKDPNKEKEPKKKPKTKPEPEEDEPVDPVEEDDDPIEEMKAYMDKQKQNLSQWKSIT